MESQFQPRTHTSKSGQETIMNLKEPGDKTGEYYILVSNLPFRIKWQNFKDWIRSLCPRIPMVVQVFCASSSGWIKVWGRHAFETVFGQVNGGTFHGRSIFACGRNATEVVCVKELIQSSRKKNPLYSAPQPFSQNGGSNHGVQPPSQEEKQIPEIQVHFVQETVASESASDGSITSSTSWNLASLVPVNLEPVFAEPNNSPLEEHVAHGYQNSAYHATGPQRVASDCIKPWSNPSIPVLRVIKLCNLPAGASPAEVDAWIKSTTGPRFVQIELISIPEEPTVAADDTFHRTATVICRDADISKVLLSIWNGAEFSATTDEHRRVVAQLIPAGITVWEVKNLMNDPSTTTIGRSLQNGQALGTTGRV